MLKLEKIRQHRDITIRLRGREPLWSKTLGKAFGIALALHLVGFSLLSIEDSEPEILIPMQAIVVEPEAGEQYTAADGDMQLENEYAGEVAEQSYTPLAPTPYFNPIVTPSTDKIEYRKEVTVADHLFRALEERPFKPQEVFCGFVDTYEPVLINIHGQIASCILDDDGRSLVVKELHTKEPITQLTAVYHVQLDSKEGQLFWFEKKESSGERELDRLAEKILCAMKFQKNSSLLFVDGTVQFIFQVNKAVSYDYLLSEKALAEKQVKQFRKQNSVRQ